MGSLSGCGDGSGAGMCAELAKAQDDWSAAGAGAAGRGVARLGLAGPELAAQFCSSQRNLSLHNGLCGV